jgi:hypothetical protein
VPQLLFVTYINFVCEDEEEWHNLPQKEDELVALRNSVANNYKFRS